MGLESLTDTDESLEAQVAVNTDNITRLFAEQERLRDKLHVFESDRATVLLLAQKVDNLSMQLPAMVERAATQAAAKVSAGRKGDIRTWAALASSLAAVATLLYLVFH
jgi:hypothetical protein